MIRFDVITIFPELVKAFKNESLLARAEKNKLLKIGVHNLRNFTTDKHKKVDDKPFGGGLGMVIKVEPVFKAVTVLKSKCQMPNAKSNPKLQNLKSTIRNLPFKKNQGGQTRVILFTPRGKKFTQKEAFRLAKYNQLIFICGRYEGTDERIANHIADEELSVGDYVLMGGEIAAMAVIETVSRLISGVVGKPEFLKERSLKSRGFWEYPQYTRPDVFTPKKNISWQTPKVLLSGDHKKIGEWRAKHGKLIGS